MGYGPVTNGKQTPITPWLGSWAQQQEVRRAEDESFRYERNQTFVAEIIRTRFAAQKVQPSPTTKES